MVHGQRLICWIGTGLLAVGVVFSAAGCQDPELKARQAVREERIQAYLQQLEEQDIERPARIQALGDLYKAREAYHAEQFNKTLMAIEKAHLEDKEDWLKYEPSRREKIYDILRGHPEQIPGVWRQMQ